LLLALVGCWLAGNALLLLLQALGRGVGFHVWPMGEDHNWVWLLRACTSKQLPSAFWQIDGRNPLSPYWWLAVRPLVLCDWFPGLFVVRRFIDLFLTVSVFAFLSRLGGGRHLFFAFCCALLTLLWNFNAYREMILWNFLGALGLSVLSLWSYCKYLDSERGNGFYLGSSLLLYLLAIGTYTLQASAFLAVFALGLVRTPVRPPSARAWWKQAQLAALDGCLFAATFGIFWLIWVASSPYMFQMPNAGLPSRGLASGQMLEALRKAWWHPSYSELIALTRLHWAPPALALAAAVGLPCLAGVIEWARREAGRGEAGDGPGSLYKTLALTGVVILALSASTLALEASSEIWIPGTRTIMVQQVCHPLLYVGLLFAAVSPLSAFSKRLVGPATLAGVSFLAWGALLVGLEYNRELTALTRGDKRFLAALREQLPRVDQPTTILLLKTDDSAVHRWVHLGFRLVQNCYRNRLIDLQFLLPGPAVSSCSGRNTMLFASDERGVTLQTPDGKVSQVPYSQLLFASYTAGKVTFRQSVPLDELNGYQVGVLRTEPIRSLHPASGGLASRSVAARPAGAASGSPGASILP
jgi:hypothetical protein